MSTYLLPSLDLQWGDAEGLVESLRGMSELNYEGLDLSSLGAPEEEFLVSPMTLRATLMGAQNGRHFYHQECRSLANFPEHLLPEIEAGALSKWSFGALEQPKYFSFYQDAPCPAFNPNHRTKWRAHEMLHGASMFFWHPSVTRFSFYISVRLNEILPVVHWYHFDEIDRPRCPQHQGAIPKQFCVNCDKAQPFWKHNNRRSDAQGVAAKGFSHFTSELEACKKEIETGQVHETYFENLNSSRDAIGYMRSHWNRITSWSFGLWMELFSVKNIDHFEEIDAYHSHILRTSRELISAPLSWDSQKIKRLQERKFLQDLSYRFLLSMENLDDASFDEGFEKSKSWLESCSRAASDLLEGIAVDLAALVKELGELADAAVLKTGFGYKDAELENIKEGIESAGLEIQDDELHGFLQHDIFSERGPLADRFCRFLEPNLNEDQVLLQAMSFYPRIDLRLERFSMVPESNGKLMEEGVCALNESARMIHENAIGFYFGGEFRVLDFTEELSEIIRAIDNEDIKIDGLDGALFWEGLNIGLIGWYPHPR